MGTGWRNQLFYDDNLDVRVIAIPDHIVELFRRRMAAALVVPSQLAWVLSPAGEYRPVPAHEPGLIFTTELGSVPITWGMLSRR